MAARNGIAGPQERTVKITSAEFSAVASGKQEIFRFLASEVGAYLDAYNTMTVWHLRDIVSGKRCLIKSKDVKHLHVPQFEGLSTADVLNWAKRFPEVYAALPIEQNEIDQLHR